MASKVAKRMASVVKAVDVVDTPALTISEYFGTASSGDTRLSACIATVSEPCGQAYQVPEFDEYVLVISGMVELFRHNEKHIVKQGEGVLVKAGECITWTWPQACQYMIVCLPGQETEHNEGVAVPDDASDGLPTTVDEERADCIDQRIAANSEKCSIADKSSVQEASLVDDHESRSSVADEPLLEVLVPPPPLEPVMSAEALEPAASQEQLAFSSSTTTPPEEVPVSSFASESSSPTDEEPRPAPKKATLVQLGNLSQVPTEARSENAETLTETDMDCTNDATPQHINLNLNLPDYIQDKDGLMQRASSLSAFDQMLNAEEMHKLRTANQVEVQDIERPARYGARHLNTPIVVVSSELNPWSKTGGLAMVAGSYAYEFAVRGHRTMAVAPAYSNYEKCDWVGKARIWLDGQDHEVNYLHQRQEYGAGKGCDYIFVDHSCYKRPQGLYGDPAKGGEYEDNLFRFALLTLAAAEAPLVLNLGGSAYGQEVCFIANDWQTGLLPVYLKHKYKKHNTYMRARCMYVLHNMGYQGKYKKGKFSCDRFLGLPQEAENDLQGEDLNYGRDCINLLAAGIRLADRILTVSPSYALEIQTPEGGLGIHNDLKHRAGNGCLAGILNGISDEWNPHVDPNITVNYSLQDFEEGKARCKVALQQELGLQQDPNACLIGFCGRLCYQKGVHIILEIMPWLMEDTGNGVTGRVQVALMGKGEPTYEAGLRNAEGNHRGKVCGYVGFKAEVEHRMMAGSDLLLMPSQYEPCGLPQMYAQMYGTLPVVHETGGLKDSVRGLWDPNRDESVATGFLFSGFDANHLKERLYQAMDTYHHKRPLFRKMQRNAMQADYYWPQAIDEYEKQIDKTLECN